MKPYFNIPELILSTPFIPVVHRSNFCAILLQQKAAFRKATLPLFVSVMGTALSNFNLSVFDSIDKPIGFINTTAPPSR